MDRLLNMLGAASVAISDAQSTLIEQHAGLKPSASSVILTLGQHDLQTITKIEKIAGLTHSATVRLIDGLERENLILRKRRDRQREVAVSLTKSGKSMYATLRKAQDEILNPLLREPSKNELRVLESALSHILAVLTSDREKTDHICRFCDEGVCNQNSCPVELQAKKAGHA